MIKSNHAFIIHLVFLGFAITALSCGVEKRQENIIDKIKTVDLGMSKDEVIKILGEPFNVLESERNGILYVEMIYQPPSRIDSIYPTVLICKETGKVIAVIVDDSGRYDKKVKSLNPCSELQN
jgi:outer membrane protein assembly factor BamE (lipoprotein component of BamABCDE complex)